MNEIVEKINKYEQKHTEYLDKIDTEEFLEDDDIEELLNAQLDLLSIARALVITLKSKGS
ncbi:hypothetical protein ACWOE8_19530 [Enterococcus avium]